MYPLVWGLCEGGNVLSPTGEMVWYGILDLILGILFLYYFIFGLRTVDYESFGFRSGKYTDGYGAGGGGGSGPGAATGAAAGAATGPSPTSGAATRDVEKTAAGPGNAPAAAADPATTGTAMTTGPSAV